ncbi:MAG: hypothetical protein JW809_01780 [Pirellulales bacterium]|nr:hypothetical protein [Pirellulales bacterium]
MDVRKKVLLDLFASPGTLLPMVGGASALILSWVLDGSAATTCMGLGLAGVLAGLGVFATRLILGLEDITNQAYEYVRGQKQKEREDALDRLDVQLRRDRDTRTERCLRTLRELCGRFTEEIQTGKVTRAGAEVAEIVEELFNSAVDQLRRTYELWESARRADGSAKERILQEREDVIREVTAAVEHLRGTIEQFRTLSTGRKRKELGRLRGELDEALRVARRVDQRVAAWEDNTPIQTPSEQE